MQAYVGTIVCKFGGDPVLFVVEEAIFVTSEKCPYHVTFNLDLDLEHTLGAGPCGDHRLQVWWRSSHFCGIEEAICAKKFTDGQTDGQTDGRRTPRDCISSWNEIKITDRPTDV